MNSVPFPPGSLVAGYFRDSGGDAQDLSIPQQEAAFISWCTANGLIPGRVFLDTARPGSSVVSRTGFQDMMHHFRAGAPESGLVIWSYSRFARDFDDAQFYRADLRRRGYLFYSLNDEIPEGPMGRFFEAAIDWKNEQFLQDLSRDVRRGLYDLVTRYGGMPGTPPRGFIRQPVDIGTRRDGRPHIIHRWVPDPDKTALVLQAYTMLLEGASLAEIQRTTRLYGSINSWTTFFRNPLYKGVLSFGDITINNYCEQLVDTATWEAAQRIIARRSRLSGDNPQHPRRQASEYILSGLAYCAHCGSPLSGSTERSAETGYRWQRYICTRVRRRRDCSAEGIPKIFLENLVVNIIVEHIITRDNLASCQALLLQNEADRQAGLAAQGKQLASQLASVRRRIANITDTLAEEGKSRALLSKLTDLESQETDLLSNLAQLDAQAHTAIRAQNTDHASERLAAGLRSSSARRILRGIIHRLVVERDGDLVRIQIEYYFPPEEHPPPEDDIMSISRPPVGAPLHRHRFVYFCEVPFVRKKRTPR